MSGDALLVVLIVEYVVLTAVYAATGSWGKAVYFAGAIVLSIGVLMMD